MTSVAAREWPLELRNYEPFGEVDDRTLVPWCEREGWTTSDPLALDGNWLRAQLIRAADALKKVGASGVRVVSSRAAHRHGHRSECLTKAARAVLHGSLAHECETIVNACLAADAWLPLTIPRMGDGCEPCGVVYDPCNLGPEYIRHFLRVFYDKQHFTETLGHEFFPFENRDHLVHSFLVTFMGQVILSAPVDIRARDAVARALGEAPDRLAPLATVGSLAEHVYAKRMMAPRGTAPAQWIRRVWPAVALWHDAGYDAATWNLLTTRLFSHSAAVRAALKASSAPGDILREVSTFLGDLLAAPAREALSRSTSEQDGYRQLWLMEECRIQDASERPWGRYHALFSAYEFIHLLGQENTKDPRENERRKHLAAAIASHHEQPQVAGRRSDSLTDDEAADLFVASPIGAILVFADVMSGFARTRLRSNSKNGDLGLEIDTDDAPLYIWSPVADGRLAFCRGAHPSKKPELVKLRSVWGDFLEPLAPPRSPCSRTSCRYLSAG